MSECGEEGRWALAESGGSRGEYVGEILEPSQLSEHVVLRGRYERKGDWMEGRGVCFVCA